ncbi:MAG: helicase DnaB [Synechococcaceae cyanobacterium ELA182]
MVASRLKVTFAGLGFGLLSLGMGLAWLPAQLQTLGQAQRHVLFSDPVLIGTLASNGADPRGLINEGQRPDPLDFSEAELRDLNRRFGVHGPQPRLAQLFTEGLDQLQPLRVHTLSRVEELRPVILSESRRHHINPMLVAAVLFDELQHAKPGEDAPLVAESGLFHTHGPAQLSLGELQKQGLLSAKATPEQINEARLHLLDPDRNVQVLVGKFARLSKALGLPRYRLLMASVSPRDAKGLATLAYLHNGKLDYPGRILRYMQDPELHGLIYGTRTSPTSPLI